jgi:hypothetical protein
MSFKVKAVREKSKVLITDEDGNKMCTLNSGSSIVMTESVMGRAAKCIQGLLAMSPPVISVNKVREGEPKEVQAKKQARQRVSRSVS